MKKLAISLSLSLLLGLGAACTPDDTGDDAGSAADAAVANDAASADDSAVENDAATDSDAGTPSDATTENDSAVENDAAVNDAASDTDAALPPATTVTIYQIDDENDANHPAENSMVHVENVYVSAIDNVPDNKGFWAQEANGGVNSGVFVFVRGDSSFDVSTLNIGDQISFTGKYKEFNSMSEVEINTVGEYTVGSAPSVPSPLTVADYATLDDAGKEPYEGVLIQIPGDCEVLTEAEEYGNIETTCGWVRNQLDHSLSPAAGTILHNLTGVVIYNYSKFKILPRDLADMGLQASEDGGMVEDSGAGSEDAGMTEDAGSEDIN